MAQQAEPRGRERRRLLWRGDDVGAVLSAPPLMWVALGAAGGLFQVLLVGMVVVSFMITRPGCHCRRSHGG